MRAYLKTLIKKGPPSLVRWGHVLYDLMPPSLRYGKPWTEAFSLVKETERWDKRRLIQYQEERLECLLLHCYENVPYYRQVFQERDLKPGDIQSIDDLKKLPTLTKETVRKRKDDLLATNVSAFERDPAHTSGSSGTPLDFFMDKTTRPLDRALVLRHLMSLGYGKGDRLAFFNGLPLADPDMLSLYLPGSRELRLTFHQVDDRRLEMMVDRLEQFRPAFINAWPSCLYILAKWMEKNNRSIPPPKYIVTSSETQYPHIREKVESVFRCRVIDWYGQEESCAVAVQCPLGQGYHIQMEMGLIEMLPAADDHRRIIGTCLHNAAMPFVRYETGDLAVEGDGNCPCGRPHPTVQKILGRQADFVVTPEGSIVSPLILHFSFYNLDEIREAQIIQEDLNTLRILIAPWECISADTKEKVLREMRSRLQSPGMQLIIEEVDCIPSAPNCFKKPFLVSRVPLDDRFPAFKD
ncbi:MAG: phenylacetate--CoA ligase family protein [Pseudomonadota bacterium]